MLIERGRMLVLGIDEERTGGGSSLECPLRCVSQHCAPETPTLKIPVLGKTPIRTAGKDGYRGRRFLMSSGKSGAAMLAAGSV